MLEDIRCPICGSETVQRIAKKGPNAGLLFYVCTRYPECKGKVAISKKPKKPVKRADILIKRRLASVYKGAQGLKTEELNELQVDEPVTEEEIIINLMGFAAEKVAEGQDRLQIINEMHREGVPHQLASGIVDSFLQYKSTVVRKGGAKSIGCGLLMLIVGGIITGVTYTAAAGGGYYFVTIGLFIAGVLAVLRGLFYLFRG